jgi:N-acetyl-gamma-glutamyl-phosphate reductase
MIHVSIVGASGYSGIEVLRFLLKRKDVVVDALYANTAAGQRVDQQYPAFINATDLVFKHMEEIPSIQSDLVFVALPSGEGQHAVPAILKTGARVIDLGGDFRLKDPLLYEQYYNHKHTAVDLLPSAVYGLPEINKSSIRTAKLVANPGCYPTSVILGLLPALNADFIESDSISVTSMSGVTGAGRMANIAFRFSELNENIRAYKIGNHQHIPEIETTLSTATNKQVCLSFIPHLVPLNRGIYTTIHAPLKRSISSEEAIEAYRLFYKDQPFVRVRRSIPALTDVQHTNFCDIFVAIDERTNKAFLLSTIDNLVKGAAGQAIQNMNIMFGVDEREGL